MSLSGLVQLVMRTRSFGGGLRHAAFTLMLVAALGASACSGPGDEGDEGDPAATVEATITTAPAAPTATEPAPTVEATATAPIPATATIAPTETPTVVPTAEPTATPEPEEPTAEPTEAPILPTGGAETRIVGKPILSTFPGDASGTTLYAVTGSGLSRSVDGGTTWFASGDTQEYPTIAALDEPEALYAGDNGNCAQGVSDVAPFLEERWARDLVMDAAEVGVPETAHGDAASPMRLLNRGLVAALVLNMGGYFGSGTYEVIWSLFLERLGADLALIGLTFAMFGLPVLLFSPFAGRIVDRRGPFAFVVLGTVLPAITGIVYTFLVDPVLAVPLILVEATGFALLNPALYAIVAANSPPGRSSTAQGIYGAAGTLGFIAASLVAGVLAAQDIRYPFYLFSAVMIASLLIGIAIGGDRLRIRPGPMADQASG